MAGRSPDPDTPRRESASPPNRVRVPDSEDDVGLPRAKRSYVLPTLIALAVFALIIVVRLAWEWQGP